MGGGKETPRQKMVGLMYLVLMALLAMNVSKSILQSFVVINDGLEITNHHFEINNERTYTAFDKAKMNDEKKVGPYWEKAQIVKQKANEVVEYIETLKKVNINMIEPKVEGITEYGSDVDFSGADSVMIEGHEHKVSAFNLHNVATLDNYDTPTALMIGGEPANPKGADVPWSSLELKSKLQGFQEDLKKLFEGDKHADEAIADIDNGIKYPSQMHAGVEEPWEISQFYHLPLAAVVTNLTKMQADVRSLEADVIKLLLGEVSADDFKFDKLEAKVIPNTNYVFLGDTFKAEVLVAALSTTQDPVLDAGMKFDTTGGKITIKEEDILKDNITYKSGKGIFKMVANTEGTVVWGGIIKIKKPDGSYKPFEFTHEFTAAKPSLVVSPTAMNVMYRGLDNPIEVSVPGVATEKLQINISNGSKTGSNGKFNVRPGKDKLCVVSVSAEINGKNQNFGKAEFRVKNVPDPKPKFAGIVGGGNVSYSKMKASSGLIAEMENFEFDLKFEIIEFTISATVKGKVVDQSAKGPILTSGQKTVLDAIKPGQKFYIEGIKAKGPDGTVRTLGSMSFKVIN